MTKLIVKKDRMIVQTDELEDWEVKALREEIEKILSLHERHKKWGARE